VRSWKEQLPTLAEAGYRAIAYDRWGYGKSERRERLAIPFFEPDLADLESLLEQLGILRAAFIGHSDGANISLYFAARHPERVACMVAVAPHIYIEPRMIQGIEGVRQAYEYDAEFQAKFRKVHGANAERVFWGWYEGWTDKRNLNLDMRPVLQQVRCPVLVIQGLEDEHTLPEHARQAVLALNTGAPEPRAELWLAPDVGHMLPQDIPEAFNQRVLAFLSAN
jgi:pimeloyl-ACP methyl ester carboxylesterase